jgi:hypothetical protein
MGTHYTRDNLETNFLTKTPVSGRSHLVVVVVCVCVLLLVTVLTVGMGRLRRRKCRKCAKTNEKICKNINVRVY